MSILDKLYWRYATKKFDPCKKVKEEDLQLLLEGANLTASSTGLQPYRFLLIEDKEIRAKLQEHSFGQPQITDASHLIVLANITKIDEELIANTVKNTEKVRVMEEGSLEGYGKMIGSYTLHLTPEEQAAWAKNQAYIVLGNLMTLCAELNIDSCPMEGIISAEYNKILDLEKHNLSAAVALPIGYRAEDDNYKNLKKARLPLSEMVVKI